MNVGIHAERFVKYYQLAVTKTRTGLGLDCMEVDWRWTSESKQTTSNNISFVVVVVVVKF